jgi:hypothetical protein
MEHLEVASDPFDPSMEREDRLECSGQHQQGKTTASGTALIARIAKERVAQTPSPAMKMHSLAVPRAPISCAAPVFFDPEIGHRSGPQENSVTGR